MSALVAGQTALVLGGGGGIGRGIVDRFVEEGANVAVVERSPERAGDLVRTHGAHVAVLEGDCTDLDTIQRAITLPIETFGSLDTLVHCVGIFDFYQSLTGTLPELVSPAFDEIFGINVKSALIAVRCAFDALAEAQGSVVLTISEAGFYPGHGGFLYGATKWALRGLVTQLAYELAPSVRVNGVAPGGTTNTAIGGVAALSQHGTVADDPDRDQRIAQATPLRVLPAPADHAWAYAYLASRTAGRVVTGVIVNTDGGRVALTGKRPSASD